MLGSGPPSFVHALFALDPGCWTPLAQQKQAAPPVPVVLAQLSMHPASPIGLLPKPFSQLFTHTSYWQHADSVLPKSVAAVRTLVKCAVTARIRFTYPSMCRVLRGRPGRCCQDAEDDAAGELHVDVEDCGVLEFYLLY
jgi:hypothetical protein